MTSSNGPVRITGIDHVNLSVSDLDASIDFYGGLFGLPVAEDARDRDPRWVILGAPGIAFLALHERAAAGSGGRINHWGFVAEDFDGLRERLRALGVPVLYDDGDGGIIRYPRSRSLYVEDPDGNEIELTSAFGGGLG